MTTTESTTPITDAAAEVIGILFAKAFKHRAFWGPIWVSLGVALAGMLFAWLFPDGPHLPVLCAAAIVVYLWTGAADEIKPQWQRFVRLIVPDNMDHGRKGILDRPEEKWYLTAVVSAAGLWLTIFMVFGWNHWTFLAWLLGTIPLHVPWYVHHRVRKASRYWVNQWRWCRDGIKGCEDSKVIKVLCPDPGITDLAIMLKPTRTIEDLNGKQRNIASGLSKELTGGMIHLSESKYAERVVWCRIVFIDPFKQPIPHAQAAEIHELAERLRADAEAEFATAPIDEMETAA